MSIFSAIGKVVGKVAKTGLGIVTHGVSDKVFSALKSTGVAKKLITQEATNQVKARVAKIAGVSPVTPVAVLKATVARKTVKKAAKKAKRATTKKVRAPKAKKEKVVKNVKARRAPPKGGLDLARMATAWRAAGKPGTWINWVKTKQIKKA